MQPARRAIDLTFGKTLLSLLLLLLSAKLQLLGESIYHCEIQSASVGGGWTVKQDNGTAVPTGFVSYCGSNWFWMEPIALKRGSKIKAGGTLKEVYSDDLHTNPFGSLYTGNAQVKIYLSVGPGPLPGVSCDENQFWWSETPWVNVIVNQGVVTIPLTDSQDALPISGTGKSVVYLDYYIRINSFDFGATSGSPPFTEGQQASAELYLLNDAPYSTTDFYRTVVDIACPDSATSSGFIGPITEGGIVQRVWQLFPGKNLYGDNFQWLYYYKAGTTFAQTPWQSLSELMAVQMGSVHCGQSYSRRA